MPLNEQEELDHFITKNLEKGYIVPSKSSMASSVFFIKKKDGKLRLIQDYHKSNEITIKNCYPLPLASDIINKLKDRKSLLSLMFARVITTFVSRKETNRKLSLSLTKDYTSPGLYSLTLPAHWLPSSHL